MTIEEKIKKYDIITFSDQDFSEAFLGVAQCDACEPYRAVYSYSKMIAYLASQGMSEEEVKNFIRKELGEYGSYGPIVLRDDF